MKLRKLVLGFTLLSVIALTPAHLWWTTANAEEGCAALRRLDALIAEWEAQDTLHPSKIEALKNIANVLRDCTGGSSAMDSITFTGRWYTDFGVLELKQTGDRVEGMYEQSHGEIEGIVNGDVLEGKWSEAPTYREPEDKGDVEFVLSSDGKSLRGKWRNGSQSDWQYGWNGERE